MIIRTSWVKNIFTPKKRTVAFSSVHCGVCTAGIAAITVLKIQININNSVYKSEVSRDPEDLDQGCVTELQDSDPPGV